MTEHAPGPWKFVNDDGDEVPFGWSSNGYYNNPKIIAADGTEVVGCGEYNVFSGYPCGRQEANVALIVSAPTIAARLAEAEALLREAHERAMFSGNLGARISAHFAADSASVCQACGGTGKVYLLHSRAERPCPMCSADQPNGVER